MKKKLRRINFDKNFLLVALSLILILESAVLIFWSRKTKPVFSPETTMAVLKVEPNQGKFKLGESFQVKILLDTKEWQTDAADIRLRFPPQMLSVSKIIPGQIYDDYPAQKVDADNGVIIINGISFLNKTFGGKGIFATLILKGIKPGNANLIFEYTPSSTTDSNVVATKIAKDVLGEVEGASFEIY